MAVDINLELITGLPIRYQGIRIRQVPLREILAMGMDQYNLRLLPFLLSMEDFTLPDPTPAASDVIPAADITPAKTPAPVISGTQRPPSAADNKVSTAIPPGPDELPAALSLFDIFTMDQNLPALLDSLTLFCGEQEFSFDIQTRRLQVGEGYLDRENFTEFAAIILKTNAKEKPKVEKPPVFQNERQRDIWEKIQAGRQRRAKRAHIELYDLINVCQFGGASYIPMEEILSWTLWRISNCYQSILGRSAYADNFRIYCVTGEKETIENKHWTDLMKIR